VLKFGYQKQELIMIIVAINNYNTIIVVN